MSLIRTARRHADPSGLDLPVPSPELVAAQPGRRGIALALPGSMIAIAVAESLIGDLDQATDVAAISAGGTPLAAGGLLLLLAAVLLGFAAAGLGPLVRRSRTGRIGWFLLMVAIPCGGAFAMFHLALVETGAAGLDPAAMDEFIGERFHGPGPWGAPVAYFAIVGLTSVLLVLVALVRRGIVSAAAPAVFLVGMLMEAFLGDGRSELAAHWVMVVGALVAGVGLWRRAAQE